MNNNRHTHAACLLCGGQQLRTERHWHNARLLRCPACGLLSRGEPLSVAEQRAYYGDDFYAQRAAYFPTQFTGRRGNSRLRLFRRVLQQLGRLTTPGTLLDGGCGLGTFLAMAQGQGWQVQGVELSAYAARYARDHFGLPVAEASLDHLAAESASIDVVTLLDVLGDCADPCMALAEVRRVLRPGGLVVASTYDVESVLYRTAGFFDRLTRGRFSGGVHDGFFAHQTMFFSLSALQMILERQGFHVLRAERHHVSIEHAAHDAPRWIQASIAAVTTVGRCVGRPLESCVYAVKA